MLRDKACDYETGRGYCYYRDDLIPRMVKEQEVIVRRVLVALVDACTQIHANGHLCWCPVSRFGNDSEWHEPACVQARQVYEHHRDLIEPKEAK